jgi:hypothetical protein
VTARREEGVRGRRRGAEAGRVGVEAGWADLGQHLERAWGLLMDGSQVVGYGDAIPASLVEQVERMRRAWHVRDRAADRLEGLPT